MAAADVALLPAPVARLSSALPVAEQLLEHNLYAVCEHPPALRGYHATTVAGGGVSIQQIKARLGHASIETAARCLAELGDDATRVADVLDRHPESQRRGRAA